MFWLDAILPLGIIDLGLMLKLFLTRIGHGSNCNNPT
ncbi:hypothetical protein C5167_048249 [Papaver somniferum]|uniref:Uncharacterized protein n=1 Tax=Papaver somniferum TaxID=3469 RepID=A0A4Y7KLD9_PAPSO|nr:hypothetical protein C5167_048249 [Papaver somniferum]